EVEQVAALVRAAAVPDAAALHGVGGRCVDSRPGLAGVVGGRDVQVPDAAEVARLVVAGRGGAEKGERGAVVVPGDHFGELRVLDPEGRAGVEGLGPGGAVVLGDGGVWMPVGAHETDVDGVVGAR